MLPIRDRNPSGRTPYVVYLLIAVNVLGFLWYTYSFSSPLDLHRFYGSYAAIPRRITNGSGEMGLLSSMFIHSGWLHLLGNMLFLWIFGDNMEEEMGHMPFLLFYIASGVGATLIHVLAEPDSLVPLVGASGAIAGVMGGYLLLFPKAKIEIFFFLIIFFRVISMPAFVMLGIWFVFQFAGGISSSPEDGGVAYWAHAGGFVVGLVLTIPLWIRRGGRDFWEEFEGQPPHPEAPLADSGIPKIPRRNRHPGPWGK